MDKVTNVQRNEIEKKKKNVRGWRPLATVLYPVWLLSLGGLRTTAAEPLSRLPRHTVS